MKFYYFAIILTLLFAACAADNGPEKNPPADNLGPRETILKEIDDNWQGLGYTEKPAKYVALSFDDGPAGANTQNLLDVLAEKKVKATFFLIGQNIRSQKTWAQKIHEAGHELANHSDGYSALGSAEETAIRTSLSAASAALKEITGKEPALFRAPNVNYGANLTNVCTELGLAIIGVSIWSNDWQSGITAESIKNNVLTGSALADGGIINCHEPNTAPNTVAALPAIIDGLREKGYWILTVGQLAAVKEKTLEAGTRYDTIK
jgi:peptidoglycan/xylan/chitin deacetylase (PgdA/CDA1 family)